MLSDFTQQGRHSDMSAGLDSVDLVFRLTGSAVPRDYRYHVYGAVSRVIPQVHDREQGHGFGIFPISGTAGDDGTILLTDRSVLRIRVPAARLPLLLPL